MSNITIARIAGCLAIATVVGMFCGRTAAQTEPSTAPAAVAMTQEDLPDVALRGNLLAVAVFDFKSGDKTAWTNAWLVISGGKPTTQPVADNAPLPLGLDNALGPVFTMGAEWLVYSVSTATNSQNVTLCIRLRPGVSEDAAVKWLHRTVRTVTHFDHDGPWLVVSVNSATGNTLNNAAAGPLSPQADEVRRELNCWGEDVPVKVVYVSSEPVKKQLMRGGTPPAVLMPLANLYFSAKYIYFGAKLGVHPQIEARWAAPDENGADQVIKEFQTMRTALKQPNNDLNLPPAFASILDQFQPTRDGNIARLSMGQKDLSNLFASVVSASMNGGNVPQSQVRQQPVSPDWKPIDPATDSAAAQMRLILAAIAEYDQDHQALPASLDDLLSAKLLPGAEMLRDPRSPGNKGFIYVKPAATKLADIPSRDKMAILFEDKAGQADDNGLKGYADGHVELGPEN
ncbi:MAG: hypothetical protein ABSB74_17790 [Tepidisphaeraceae bacterium]